MAITVDESGLPSAEEILEPSPGAKLRRRMARHVGITLDPDVWLRVAQLLADESA